MNGYVCLGCTHIVVVMCEIVNLGFDAKWPHLFFFFFSSSSVTTMELLCTTLCNYSCNIKSGSNSLAKCNSGKTIKQSL